MESVSRKSPLQHNYDVIFLLQFMKASLSNTGDEMMQFIVTVSEHKWIFVFEQMYQANPRVR